MEGWPVSDALRPCSEKDWKNDSEGRTQEANSQQ